MEAHVRNFGDRVNFLYNYIIEAHPNPENAPCGSTEDLGWNHLSRDTRSMEDRAQRARWLKSDFDLTFPFMIDTMSNTILRTYWGSRFYSGWVIDCDGEVIEAETWGWATPATQWCGLPLADNNELIGLLNQYVDRPSGCWNGGPQTRAIRVIPAVSHTDGVNNTRWRTDVVIVNPHDDELEIELRLRGLGPDPAVKLLTLAGRDSMVFSDVVAETFGSEGTGSLWIEADTNVIAAARISTDGGDGVFGQMVRGLPVGHAVAQPMVGHLFPLEESASLRTNIGLANVASGESAVRLLFIDHEGLELGTIDLTLAPGEHRMLARALTMVTSGSVAGARVEITTLDESSAVMAYASAVDNVSGDPIFIEAVPHLFAFDMVMPGVARTAGVDGTEWSSEVAVVNRNSKAVQVNAFFMKRGSVDADPPSIQIELQPWETRVISDPVQTLFDDLGSGAVIFSGLDGIAASGRTFNSGGPDGTFGQRVAGLDLSGEAIVRNSLKGHLIALEESSRRRTNVGLVNAGAVEVQAKIRFFNAAGKRLGVRTIDIPVGSFVQLDRVFRLVTDKEIQAGRVEITLPSGIGRLTGYASTIDLGTGDPVYQPFWIEHSRSF